MNVSLTNKAFLQVNANRERNISGNNAVIDDGNRLAHVIRHGTDIKLHRVKTRTDIAFCGNTNVKSLTDDVNNFTLWSGHVVSGDSGSDAPSSLVERHDRLPELDLFHAAGSADFGTNHRDSRANFSLANDSCKSARHAKTVEIFVCLL